MLPMSQTMSSGGGLVRNPRGLVSIGLAVAPVEHLLAIEYSFNLLLNALIGMQRHKFLQQERALLLDSNFLYFGLHFPRARAPRTTVS